MEPNRSATKPPRGTRSMVEAPMGAAADHHHGCSSADYHESFSSMPQPQHHQLSQEQPTTISTMSEKESPQFFDFLYQVIFSLVHLALTAVLTPVMGRKKSKKSRRTNSHHAAAEYQQQCCPPSPPIKCMSSTMPPPSHMDMMDDPESGMSVSSGSVSSHSSRDSSHSSHRSSSYPQQQHHQPILRRASQQQPHQSSLDDIYREGSRKTVRFPVPERSRPPLGRIGAHSSSSVSSSSVSSTSSSSSSAESRRESTRRTTSRREGSSHRRTPSPLGRLASRRMHSTYFLE